MATRCFILGVARFSESNNPMKT